MVEHSFEILIAFVLLLLGSPFLSMLKSRGHFASVLADEVELRRLVEFLTPEKLIEEGRRIKCVPKSTSRNPQRRNQKKQI